ncbi:MAG: DNA repair protein RecN [Coprobacillus sp.]
MLKSLYVSSFVIIDKMRVDFENGMSVMTGETGAGKSIVIDALGQLCGNRSSTSLIKKNCSKAIIEGVFDVEITPAITQLCEELHIDVDEQFVISKEILDSGKSNIKINYQNASNNALKLLIPHFIDIHSQFETQKLFEEKNHILLLDQFSKKDLYQLLNSYHDTYSLYKEAIAKLKKTKEEDMSDEQLEFLESQLNEIDELTYTDNDIEEFEEELKVLQNFEKMSDDIQAFDTLMNSSQGSLPIFKNALSHLHNLSQYEQFEEHYNNLYDQYYNVMDGFENVMDIYRGFQFDEYRFNELQETLYKVNRLKRKYGFTMTAIAEFRDEISEKINAIKNREEVIEQLEKEVQQRKDEAYSIASEIHIVRNRYAGDFEIRIQKELNDLYLEKAIFKVKFEEVELNQNGFDKISFMVSINKGQDLTLLTESASGGEISRIMLAIKTIILEYSSIDTIIFDEVDTGVSGKVATSIGEKMSALAKKKQVICITHLPQVASLATHHFCIEKEINDHETLTSVRLLNNEQRIQEIAKMLSGERITQEAIENAKQLLNV